MASQAMGDAITMAIRISFMKSLDSNVVMLRTVAPSTFRMPISLVRCSVVNDVKPSNPRHDITMATPAKKLNS
ncbi:hypothetical protein D3C86_2104850 [compost metagenome]